MAGKFRRSGKGAEERRFESKRLGQLTRECFNRKEIIPGTVFASTLGFVPRRTIRSHGSQRHMGSLFRSRLLPRCQPCIQRRRLAFNARNASRTEGVGTCRDGVTSRFCTSEEGKKKRPAPLENARKTFSFVVVVAVTFSRRTTFLTELNVFYPTVRERKK